MRSEWRAQHWVRKLLIVAYRGWPVSSATADPRTGEDDVKQVNRKPFVVPTVKELASLSSVTLLSGGGGGGTPT